MLIASARHGSAMCVGVVVGICFRLGYTAIAALLDVTGMYQECCNAFAEVDCINQAFVIRSASLLQR